MYIWHKQPPKTCIYNLKVQSNLFYIVYFVDTTIYIRFPPELGRILFSCYSSLHRMLANNIISPSLSVPSTPSNLHSTRHLIKVSHKYIELLFVIIINTISEVRNNAILNIHILNANEYDLIGLQCHHNLS